MIQRIQTVYLLIVVVINILMLFFPFAEIVSGESYYEFDVFGISPNHDMQSTGSIVNTTPVLILSVITILLPLINIFMYKKRTLQLKLGQFTILLLSALVVLAVYYADEGATAAGMIEEPSKEGMVNYGISMILPVTSIIFMFLANRSIRKDEELVRSTERLR